MAEDDGKGSGRSRFKSKWGKILKHSDDIKTAGDSIFARKGKPSNSKEEVDDFLKPSVERAAANRPRLDVSLAQRWPQPGDGRQTDSLPPDGSQSVNGWRKRRRREGLTVGFVKTVPEYIGHGGDETLDPPSDIALQKVRNARAGLDNRQGGQAANAQMPTSNTLDGPRPLPSAGAPSRSFEAARPPPQNGRPSLEELPPPPPRIGIHRAPTGFSPKPDDMSPVSDNDSPPSLPTIRAPDQNDSGLGLLKVSPAPSDPNNLTTRRRSAMVKNEGMALRRASAMIEPIDFEDGSELDLGVHGAATATYRAEAAATPPISVANHQPTFPIVDPQSPQSDASLDSPSPFADERYIKRHSREAPTVPIHTQPQQVPEYAPAPPPPGSRSPFADPKYLQSRSKESSPARAQRQDGIDQTSHVPQPALELSRHYLDPQQEVHPASLAAQEDNPRLERPQNPDSSFVVPQGPRQAPPSHRTPSPLEPSQSSTQPPLQALEQPLHMEAMKPIGHENTAPASTRPMPAPRLIPHHEDTSKSRDQSPHRNRIFDTSTTSQKPPTFTSRPNGSSTSVNRFAPPTGGHSRTNSYDLKPSSSMERTFEGAGPLPPPHGASSRATSPQAHADARNAPHHTTHLAPHPQPHHEVSGASTQLAVPSPSPYARRPSANDYFSVDRPLPTQPAKSPAASVQASDALRPGSDHSGHSFLRPAPPSRSPSAADLAAQAAFDDFTSRVAHMKGVFALTAEKEQPAARCTPSMWLRAAYWWYLRGKIGLESLLQQRAKSHDTEPRELLLQPHVDLAKTSWMLSDPLESYNEDGPSDGRQRSDSEALLRRDLHILKDHLKSLSHSMLRSNAMPPYQSLIQGQDTQIWLQYPNFAPDAAAALRGAGVQQSLGVNNLGPGAAPSDALPLGDTNDYHYYTRSTVNISLNTDDVNTDRVSVPCNLTVLRGKRDYQSTVIIASQSELVYIKIAPRQSNTSHTAWQDVSWKASSLAITVNLPHGIDLTVRFFEHDFRALWNLVEYSRRIDHSLRSDKDEELSLETQLVEVQYADSSNAKAFPQDKVKRCRALLWEKVTEYRDGSAVHKRHRGFRLAVATDAGQKSLNSFSHDICGNTPLFFEFITDAAAQGTTAMVIRVKEQAKQCRMLLVFQDMEDRQALYNKLNGIDVRADETIVGKMALTGLNIESMTDAVSGSSSGRNELAALQWQRLGVTNQFVEDPNNGRPNTVESQSLRVIARHGHGCITDRMNLNRGELLLRLPCVNSPTIQILRQPQADMTMSIDVRKTPHNVSDSIVDVHQMVQNLPTVRTMTFATPGDLHAFQTAITGFTVRFDGLASTLGISRRRMVVPIYHKWTASSVRIQVVSNAQNSVFQLIAFMEGFAHAEALCFPIKSTDVFETIKGDGKNKKWAVKMVDAKFTLPPANKDNDFSPEEKAKRRFVNLEGLDYAQEHDDITVGFDSEEARDTFAKCLPAATTTGRLITLKRRI